MSADVHIVCTVSVISEFCGPTVLRKLTEIIYFQTIFHGLVLEQDKIPDNCQKECILQKIQISSF